MIELECACDGGKDSLSMAAAAGGKTVMAPGNLVVSAYVGCPDITKVVTPDLKLAGAGGQLLHVDLASVARARRVGGSALAQAYSQVRGVRYSCNKTTFLNPNNFLNGHCCDSSLATLIVGEISILTAYIASKQP